MPAFKALRLNLGTAPVSRNHLIEPNCGRRASLLSSWDASAATFWVWIYRMVRACVPRLAIGLQMDLEIMAAFPESQAWQTEVCEMVLAASIASVSGKVRCSPHLAWRSTLGLSWIVPYLPGAALLSLSATDIDKKDLRQILQSMGFPWSILVIRGRVF